MQPTSLIEEIDAFLRETDMGPSYFGKIATGNSELVGRLRAGRRLWPETEKKVRDFIRTERRKARRVA